MIKQIKMLEKKYKSMTERGAEMVFITEIMQDLFWLEQECRLKRIPKDER